MDYSHLSKAPLFKGMTADAIEIIFTTVPFKVKRFLSGSMISQSGETVNSLIVVINGTVKGEMVDYAGRVIKIEDIHAPGALAPAFIFGDRNRYPVNVIAVTDGEMLMIDKTDFLKMLMKYDFLLMNFLDILSNRSQFLSEKIKFLNFKTIRGKLANFILQKTVKDGMNVTLGMTQIELADFFGVARPSIARAIGTLEEEGYIEAKGKSIKIIDKKGLSDLSTD
jgi:CRP/FNR family transcriptional regulator, dissimilatory nitrate respiration regulator